MPWKPIKKNRMASFDVGKRNDFSYTSPANSTRTPTAKRRQMITIASAWIKAYFVEAKLPPQIVTAAKIIKCPQSEAVLVGLMECSFVFFKGMFLFTKAIFATECYLLLTR